jgi:hypothetical protein
MELPCMICRKVVIVTADFYRNTIALRMPWTMCSGCSGEATAHGRSVGDGPSKQPAAAVIRGQEQKRERKLERRLVRRSTAH